MTLDPKEIIDALEREEIDKSTAVDLLIYLIGNNDLIEYREDSIKNLQWIGIKNSKVFSVLENVLVSDPNQEIRKLAVESLVALFQEKALPPLKWALDHEKSWEIILLIISIIRDINNSNSKAILYDKIKKIEVYEGEQFPFVSLSLDNETKMFVANDIIHHNCMPCIMLAPIIEELADSESMKQVKFTKINIDDNQELANKYKITSIPCLIVFKQGKEIDRIVGNQTQEAIEEKIKKHLKRKISLYLSPIA